MINARTMRHLTASPWRKATSRDRAANTGRRADACGLVTTPVPLGCDGHVWDRDQEPDIDSMLADPIVGLVMTRDGLSPDDVAQFVRHARARLVH